MADFGSFRDHFCIDFIGTSKAAKIQRDASKKTTRTLRPPYDIDYALAKEIVQSGQSDEDWDALRQGKGPWPDDERRGWQQYRKYSLDKLMKMMDSYKQTSGTVLYHPLISPFMILLMINNEYFDPSLPIGTWKAARTQRDTSKETTKALCPPFDCSVVSDVHAAINALRSPIIAPIPVERIVSAGSGMQVAALFTKTDGEEAFDFVHAFEAFEGRCVELCSGSMSEELVLCAITSITAFFWRKLASHVDPFGPVLTYNYNAKDFAGTSQAGKRPDETIFLNDFLAGKGEHKCNRTELGNAVAEQMTKLAGYNHVEYGTHIVCLPVYSAAGSLVEYGVVDVRTKLYYPASRFNVVMAADRCECFVGAINFFRLLRTMAPYIPNSPSPIFRDLQGLTFFDKYVLKKVPEACTCPQALYDLLATGSVPCAAKVEKSGKKLKVSPVGVRTPDRGQGLSLAEVRTAIKACLKCLAYLHHRNFVHRDIRWANLIRVYKSRSDGSVESVSFIVIDFEFSGEHGEPMLIQDYIFRDEVPYGQPYNASHDLFFVGKLILTWAESNNITLDALAQSMVETLQSGPVNAQDALALEWLA